MKNKLFRVIFIAITAVISVFPNNGLAQEKVVISNDRDIYVAGENVWFNLGTYQLDSNKPANLSKVIYVELLNKNNDPVLQTKYRVDKQSIQSYITLPDTLSTGNYLLRAYTRWMRNKDASLYAYSNIAIVNPFVKNSMPKGDHYYINDTICVYPEGKSILSGVENKLVLFACDRRRTGKNITGNIINSSGDSIVGFDTDASGYGTVFLSPKEGEEYFVQSGEMKYRIPEASSKGNVLSIKNNNGKLWLHVLGEIKKNASLIFLTKDGHFIRQVNIPDSKRLNISSQGFNSQYLNVLLVEGKVDVLASRAFSLENNHAEGKINITLGDQSYKCRQEVNLTIGGLESLNDVTVSVVKSCMLNSEEAKGSLSYNDALILRSNPSFQFMRFDDNRLLPELEGEFITGKITNMDTGEPITDKKFMLNVVGTVPVMKFSETDSLGNFRFLVNRYGNEEIVIQPRDMDTINYNFRLTIDDAFSTDYMTCRDKGLVLTTDQMDQINDAIINMQVNTLYKEYKTDEALADSLMKTDAFYGKPDVSVKIDRYIELPTVEEVMIEIVPFAILRKNSDGYYFKIFERKSLFKRDAGTITMLDGVPIKNAKSIVELSPQDLERVDVVNLSYFLKSEELGYLLCFFSRNQDMAEADFDDRIFRQVHNGYRNSYKMQSPDYSDLNAKKSRLADFRNLLYYTAIDQAKESVNLNFYSSDDESDYTVVVRGLDKNGEFVEARKNFTVRDQAIEKNADTAVRGAAPDKE
jgi:hypothetical protein